MDASDDQSYGECNFDAFDYDFCGCKRETVVLLKKEPGPWIAHNPDRLSKVINLKLELPDQVYNISDSIGDLFYLQHLIIKGCIYLNCLPHTLPTLLNLKLLHLENCPNLSQLPFHLGDIIALRYFTLRDCGIKSLPHSLSQLKLWDMELNNCVFIQELPASLYVENLKLVGCHVKSFSAKPRHLPNLDIINCLYVFDILTTLNHFGGLYTLQIKSCDMESLPNSISGIRTILIEDCIKLKRLPKNLTQVVAYYVNSLTLVNCGLESIPSGLRIVGSLSIKNCPIKSLDGCITGLTKLYWLTIRDCVALENLPTDINTLVTLQKLYIEGCTRIKFLPNIAALYHLSVLSLKGCLRLDELPADFDDLPNLKSLNLTDTNVQSLPSAITKLPILKNVHLPRSFRLDKLPDKVTVTKLRSAYKLHLKDQKNKPPNPTHLPQPIPGICMNLDGEACREESRQAITHNQIPLQPFTVPEESWQEVFDEQTNSRKTLNLIDAFHSDEQVLAGTPGYLDEGRSFLRSAFRNLDIGRNRMGFAHDGEGPSKQIEASEYWHGENKHIMNYYHVMSQRESRDSESIDSNSCSVRSKALSKESTSLLRTKKRKMVDSERLHSWSTLNATQIGQVNGGFMENNSLDAADGRLSIFVVNAIYKDALISFDFLSTSSIAKLKEEMLLRLPLEENKMKIKYLDEEQDWVLLACPGDMQHCLRLSTSSKSNIIRLMIFDS